MLRRLLIFVTLAVYGMASVGLLGTSWTLFHKTSFQYLVKEGAFSNFTTLTFTPEQFEALQWTEKGREFTLDGKMFDISEIERVGDNYVVKCKHDVIESVVRDFFDDDKGDGDVGDHGKPKKKNGQNKNRVAKFFPGQKTAYEPEFLLFQSLTYSQLSEYSTTTLREVESPPPEQIFSPTV
ncbi:MAG: hypothetical protein AB7O48_07005 [Cyclobacteriaceae bacterium]